MQSTTKEDDRRSSVRVKSLLPVKVRPIDEEVIAAIEARILDLAVLESDGIKNEIPDWSERTDELPRDVVFLLNEVRALRQQISEIQRLVELQQQDGLESRWVVLNDRGLYVFAKDDDPEIKEGDHVEVRVQIPSLVTPDLLAVGEIIRVATDEGAENGFAIVFRYISSEHSKAIIRYALRRERQLARSVRFH